MFQYVGRALTVAFEGYGLQAELHIHCPNEFKLYTCVIL